MYIKLRQKIKQVVVNTDIRDACLAEGLVLSAFYTTPHAAKVFSKNGLKYVQDKSGKYIHIFVKPFMGNKLEQKLEQVVVDTDIHAACLAEGLVLSAFYATPHASRIFSKNGLKYVQDENMEYVVIFVKSCENAEK
ncbi:MAG: hypothetical protein LBR82_08540 [Desulfovibrio sp.]|jgi:hypothetical protein|nr:hypothetical protein [Desulfovibrio sp.]